MNLYLDCEFNGFKGQLLSTALVAENGDYWHGALQPNYEIDPWVKDNVLPVYRRKSTLFLSRKTFNESFRDFLQGFYNPNICVDWYADLEYFFSCFNGDDYPTSFAYACTTQIKLIDKLHSSVPHNAYFDALALKQQWSEQ